MDAVTMGWEVRRKCGVAGYNLLNFDDREVSAALNDAMDEFILERFTADANAKQKGFGADAKRKLDMAGLISASVTFRRDPNNLVGGGTSSSAAGNFMLGTIDNGAFRKPYRDFQSVGDTETPDDREYGIFCMIPDEAVFIISETCDTSKPNGTSPDIVKLGVPVENVGHEEYGAKIHNRYDNPFYNKVWRLDWGSYNTASEQLGWESTKFTGTNGEIEFKGTNADDVGAEIVINTYRSACLVPGKDWTIENWRIHYVVKPARIHIDSITPNQSINCTLPEPLHAEIVDKAVAKIVTARLPEQAKLQVVQGEDVKNQ